MKKGYSILLGEHLPAASLIYRDCEHFQVVCPVCREPVFKVVRQSGREDALHYLSHYSTSSSFDSDCELRTSKLLHDQTASHDRTSRNQRLEHFLAVLKSTLSMDPMYVKSAEKSHWALNKSTALAMLRDGCYEIAQAQRENEEFFQGCVHGHLRSLEQAHWELQTSFSIEIQGRISRDMWLLLTTGAGKSNFDFLFNHAFMKLTGSWLAHMDTKGDGWQMSAVLATYMRKVLEARGAGGAHLLGEMARKQLPPEFNLNPDGRPDSETSTLLTRIASNTVEEMVGVLLELPYFELLKQKFGDPSKVYPYQPGAAPTTEEEKARIKALREKHLPGHPH